jgi:hypothetical protein
MWHHKLNFTVFIWTAVDMKIVIIVCFKEAPFNAGTVELEGL